MIESGMATLHELSTVYGTQDLYDFLEMIAVNAHNQRALSKPRRGDA